MEISIRMTRFLANVYLKKDKNIAKSQFWALQNLRQIIFDNCEEIKKLGNPQMKEIIIIIVIIITVNDKQMLAKIRKLLQRALCLFKFSQAVRKYSAWSS